MGMRMRRVGPVMTIPGVSLRLVIKVQEPAKPRPVPVPDIKTAVNAPVKRILDLDLGPELDI